MLKSVHLPPLRRFYPSSISTFHALPKSTVILNHSSQRPESEAPFPRDRDPWGERAYPRPPARRPLGRVRGSPSRAGVPGSLSGERVRPVAREPRAASAERAAACARVLGTLSGERSVVRRARLAASRASAPRP
jgi:hypothetical protein